MKTRSAVDLRREIIDTRERLDAADGMETRIANLRHHLETVVEAQRRSRSHEPEMAALGEAFDTFIDPGGRVADGITARETDTARETETARVTDSQSDDDTQVAEFVETQFPYLRGAYVEDDGTRHTVFDAFREDNAVESTDLKQFLEGLKAFVRGKRYDEEHRLELRSAFLEAAGASTPTPERLLSFVELAVAAARTYRSDLRARLNTTVADDGTEEPGLIQQFLTAAESSSTDPASFLADHPVALLPVRLETRFVTGQTPLLNETPDREPHLRVRVFPDDIHVDTHEAELTAEEERLGRFFWAKLWLCSHPDPAAAMGAADGASGRTDLVERAETTKHLKATIDPHEFDSSDDDRAAYHKLYHEVKERSWRRLVDRFGRERAAWIVHRTAPEEIAAELFEGWTSETVASDGGENGSNRESGPFDEVIAPERRATNPVEFGKQGPFGSAGPANRSRFGWESDTAGTDQRTVYSPPFEKAGPNDPNGNVPPLSFPPVENRPESWTKQPRARLLPDQWVVYGWTERTAPTEEGDDEWDLNVPQWARDRLGDSDLQLNIETQSPDYASEFATDGASQYRSDGAGERSGSRRDGGDGSRTDGGTQRAPDLVKRGPAIREPLPLGPDPKADGDHSESPTETTDAQAPEGMDWTVDFAKAERAGMGVRIDGDDLRVTLADDEDVTDVTFERLVVVAVKATMSGEQSTTGLRALFEAHHYTDGLEFLEHGTPTNNTTEDSGYTKQDDPEESVEVECGPPLAGFGDDARPEMEPTVPTDGDLLARTLGIADPDVAPHDHVFAHVEGADRVDVAAQHHANTALWDGTIGYYLRNVALSTRWTGDGSIWDDSPHTGPYADPTQAGTFFDEPRAALGGSMVWEDHLRRHFVRYVRAEGPLPTVRTGDQPYGILPVTDVDRLASDDVVDLVTTLRGPFERAADGLTHVGDDSLGDEGVRRTIRRILQRTTDGDAYRSDELAKTDPGDTDWRRDLADALWQSGLPGIDQGEASLDPRLGWLQPIGSSDSPGTGSSDDPVAASHQLVGHTDDRFLELLSGASFDQLRRMGLAPNWDSLTVKPKQLPDHLTPKNPEWGFTDEELLFYALTRATASEWEQAATKGWINWGGSGDHSRDAVRTNQAPPHINHYYLLWDLYDQFGDPGTLHTLLRTLSRFSLIQGYVGDRIRAAMVQEDLPSLSESVTLGGPVPDPGTTGELTVWDWLETSVGGTNASYLETINRGEYRAGDVRTSLSVLSTLRPATLQRLLTGTLGLASHRFDAWWTSLATRRLAETRRSGTALRTGGAVSSFTREVTRSENAKSDAAYDVSMRGESQVSPTNDDEGPMTYVGGYGFVEDLSADDGAGQRSSDSARAVDRESEGRHGPEFTQAPTVQHATTAALLRGPNKELDDPGLAVDLSADRVRKARRVLRGLKHGQGLGVLLGYRFERYIKEHGTGDEIARLAEYRTAFPAVAGTLDHGGTTDADDAEFDVTDGYRLYRTWQSAGSPTSFFADADHPRGSGTIEAAIEDVAATVEAVQDLLLAEDVHQLGMGNFERAGWSLDGLANGEGVPDLDVLETPRDGVDVSHRTMALFGEPSAASPPSAWTVSSPTVDLTALPTPPDVETAPDPVDGTVTAVQGLPDDGGSTPGTSAHPRREAAANLNAWVAEFLPDHGDVGCRAAFQWTNDRAFSGGTFTTPTEATTVSVQDVGFEPDLLVFTASTAVKKAGSTVTGDGAVGWCYGAAARTDRGITESSASVVSAPGGATASTSDDQAISMVRLDGTGTTERTVATLARTTDDGFDLSFSTVESDTPVVVEYVAVKTGAVGSVDIGHFPTPGGTGTHSESLSVDADHVELTVASAGAPGVSRGYAVRAGGGVTGLSTGVGGVAGGDPAVGVRPDRAIHLPYGSGTATSASVTSLGSNLDVEFSAAPETSFRDDGGHCIYVAVETPEPVAVPTVGVVGAGHNDCGFEPGVVSLLGVPGVQPANVSDPDTGTDGVTTTASGAVGLSDGVSVGAGRQWSVTHAVRSDGPGHAAFAGVGAAGTFLDVDSDGTVTGRTTCEITDTDATGFTAAYPDGDSDDGVFVYVAWPAPPETVAHEEPTSATVADLDLTPVDLLYHSQQESDAAESQLEQRLAHHLFLDRDSLSPEFPIPDDAAIDLRFTDAPPDASFSMAEMLEVLRSLRDLALDGRAVTADDLIHPAEAQGTGYTEPASGRSTSTVGDLRDRALGASKTLRSVRKTVENRRAALTATDEKGRTLTERVTDLREAVEAFDAGVPTAEVRRATADLDADDVTAATDDPGVSSLGIHLPGTRAIDAASVNDVGDLLLWELETLSRFLPAGPTEPSEGGDSMTVMAMTDRTVGGTARVNGRAEIDLTVWRGSPSSSFAVHASKSLKTDGTGGFQTTIDCSDATPGEHLTVVATFSTDLTNGSGDDSDGTTDALDSYPYRSVGDVVYAATSRVVDPDAEFTVEVDPDASATPTGTVEAATDLDGGTSVTVEAARPDGKIIDSTSVTADADGGVSATLSFGGVDPRTAFGVTATVAGESVFQRAGCTLSPDDARSATEVLSTLSVLPRLLWLDGETDALDPTADGTPGERLRDALEAVDWDRVDDELAAMRSSRGKLDGAGIDHPLTDRVLDALTSVTAPDESGAAAIESFEPLVLHTNLDRLIEPLAKTGTTGAFSVVGTPVDRSSLDSVPTPGADLGRVRAAIDHAVENPAVLRGETDDVYPSFAPAFRAYVADDPHIPEEAAPALSHYLAQLQAYPGEFVVELDEHVDAPHEFLRHLGAMLYEPDRFATKASPSTFKRRFRSLVAAIPDLPSLEEMLTPSPIAPRWTAEIGDPSITATLDGSSVSAPSFVSPEIDDTELELVVENTSASARTVELDVGGPAPDSLVFAGDTSFELAPGEERRVEIAVVRPDTGVASATVTIRDRTASMSATVDVLTHSPRERGSTQNRKPVNELQTLLVAFSSDVLDGYVSAITSGSGVGLPAPSTARSDYTDDYTRWVSVAADAADGARARIETALDAGTNLTETDTASAKPLDRGAFDDALRIGMLEPLRRVLLRASYAGIYGATPQSPAGGDPQDVEDLVAQADAVVERIDNRFREANAALADLDGSTATDETVDALSTAVEAILDDAFTVFPVFEPHNPSELLSTFANGSLLPDDDPLAAESFLARISRVRDRPDAMREAYAYGEVVTGESMLDLTVGQLPHRAGDEWVGVSDTGLSTNRQSIVAQLETGAAANGVAGGPLAGVFVDNWNETVPERTQTAGVAVNYDSPDATGGNAVLLATPPADEWSWTAGDIQRMVVDAADTMKLRMVDPAGARSELDELLPAIWLPDVDDPEPPAPSVDLSLLDHDAWETYHQNLAVYGVLRGIGAVGLRALSEVRYETFANPRVSFQGGMFR